MTLLYSMPWGKWCKLIASSHKIHQKCKCCGADMELIDDIQVCKCGCTFDGWQWRMHDDE